MMDDFWSRVRALESRIVPGETLDDRIREQWARDEEHRRDDALIAWANKKLASQDLLLVRNNLFDNPSLGKFYVRQITSGEVVLADANPRGLAQRLADGVRF